MPRLDIRRASRRDAAAVARVHVDAWQQAYRGLLGTKLLAALSVGERARAWRELLGGESEEFFALVAEVDGRAAGFVAAATPSRDEDAGPDTAEVGALYVSPRLWRQGTGTALLEAAMERFGVAGFGEVTLWVLAGNEPARRFYTARGFRPDGGRRTGQTGKPEERLRARLPG